MIYRYAFIAFIGTISLIFISAGLSSETTQLTKYTPGPTFSGGPGTGGLGDRTGSPVSSATCAACHSGGGFNVSVSLDVFDPVAGIPVTSYVPGTTYQVTYAVTGNASAYGFQGGVLTSTNAAGGSFSLTLSPNTQLVTIAGRPYLEHANGPSATGVFQALWTAPNAGSGNVTFYGIGLGVNQNGGTSGDNISTPFSQTLTESVPTTVNYPGNPYCGNESDPTPTSTGQSGGTYTSAAGLVINSSTGVVDVSMSTPGDYVVTYTYSTGSTTANISVLSTASSSFNATICDNETLNFGSLVLDGSDAGFHVQTFQAANSCDSIVTLTLFVTPTYTESQTATICSGDTYDFNGQILTEANAGLNTAVLQSSNGCDSTVNLTLSVEVIDNTVFASGAVLTANQVMAAYQWVNCDNGNAPISGATNATFTPTATGNYAVEVTVNGCTEMSACTLVDFSSIEELNLSPGAVFPNPVTDFFEIKNKASFGDIQLITLVDARGKVVLNIPVDETSTNIGHLEAGIYFLTLVNEKGESVISVVKK